MLTLAVVLGIVHLHTLVIQAINYDLPKPNLSTNPPVRVFLKGEKIILTCRCQCPVSRIHYYRGQVLIIFKDTVQGMCEDSFEFMAGPDFDGNHTCDCLLEQGGWVQSERSNTVQIISKDELQEPTIFVEPQSGTISNGEVHITCKLDIHWSEGVFHLYKQAQRTALRSCMVTGAERTATFHISTLNEGNAGRYRCRYETDIGGRSVESPFSAYVNITVKGKLPVPIISMDPVSGVVSNGEKFYIICTVDLRSKGGLFNLYSGHKEKPVQSSNVSDADRTVTFTINTLNKGSGETYCCRYLTQVDGVWAESPDSEVVRITVKDAKNGLSLYVGLGSAAGIMMLLFVAITWFLIAKGRKTRRRTTERSAASASGVPGQGSGECMHVRKCTASSPETNGLSSEVPEDDQAEITYASLNMEALNRKKQASVIAAEERLHSGSAMSDQQETTYASVNREKLNRKVAASPTAPDTSLYAEVKKM